MKKETRKTLLALAVLAAALYGVSLALWPEEKRPEVVEGFEACA